MYGGHRGVRRLCRRRRRSFPTAARCGARDTCTDPAAREQHDHDHGDGRARGLAPERDWVWITGVGRPLHQSRTSPASCRGCMRTRRRAARAPSTSRAGWRRREPGRGAGVLTGADRHGHRRRHEPAATGAASAAPQWLQRSTSPRIRYPHSPAFAHEERYPTSAAPRREGEMWLRPAYTGCQRVRGPVPGVRAPTRGRSRTAARPR